MVFNAAAGFIELQGGHRDESAQFCVVTPRSLGAAVALSSDARVLRAPDIGQAQHGTADVIIIDQAFMRLIADDASGQLQILGAVFTLQGNGNGVIGSQLVNPPLSLVFGKSGVAQAIDFSFSVPPIYINSVPSVTGGQGGIGPVYEVVVRNNDGAAAHSFDVLTTTIWRKISRRLP